MINIGSIVPWGPAGSCLLKLPMVVAVLHKVVVEEQGKIDKVPCRVRQR